MRVTGLASGFDIDAMVKKMMESHRAPLNKLKQQSLRLEYQQEAYRSISSALVDLRNNKLPSLSMSNAINAKQAVVTGNTSAISATSTGSSTSGVYQVEVMRLASAATVKLQTNVTTANAGENPHKVVLADLDDAWTAGPVNGNGKNTVWIGSAEIEYDASEDTLETLLAKINNNKNANVTALYSSSTGEISITSKTAGARQLTIAGDLGSPLNATELDNKAGLNSWAKVNGLDMEATGNVLNISGVSIQLKQVTGTDAPSTVTMTTDTNKIVESIKSFITEYNKVLDLINGKLGEERFRKYTPLLDEERESISDKQAELWDSKARSGLLRNDSILSQTVSNLRMAVIGNFGDPNDRFNIHSVGIATGKWQEGGKLVIENEQALREAIEADPDRVMELFASRSAAEPAAGFSKINNPQSGVFSRVSDILMDSLKSLSERAGTSQVSTSLTGTFLESSLLGEEKRILNNRIADMNQRMVALEVRYYKQFTAMESAINRYNSQAGSLASFLNG